MNGENRWTLSPSDPQVLDWIRKQKKETHIRMAARTINYTRTRERHRLPVCPTDKWQTLELLGKCARRLGWLAMASFGVQRSLLNTQIPDTKKPTLRTYGVYRASRVPPFETARAAGTKATSHRACHVAVNRKLISSFVSAATRINICVVWLRKDYPVVTANRRKLQGGVWRKV